MPGDELTIPPVRSKELGAETGTKHTFRRRVAEQPTLRLALTLNGKPRDGLAYTLDLGRGEKLQGVTDSGGVIEETVPFETKRCSLRLEGETESFEVKLGELDPLATIRGVSQRLTNLGYSCDPEESGPEPSIVLRAAIRAFREDCRVQPTSPKGATDERDHVDQELLDQLKEKHGC